jgi:hypothetical protein
VGCGGHGDEESMPLQNVDLPNLHVACTTPSSRPEVAIVHSCSADGAPRGRLRGRGRRRAAYSVMKALYLSRRALISRRLSSRWQQWLTIQPATKGWQTGLGGNGRVDARANLGRNAAVPPFMAGTGRAQSRSPALAGRTSRWSSALTFSACASFVHRGPRP